MHDEPIPDVFNILIGHPSELGPTSAVGTHRGDQAQAMAAKTGLVPVAFVMSEGQSVPEHLRQFLALTARRGATSSPPA